MAYNPSQSIVSLSSRTGSFKGRRMGFLRGQDWKWNPFKRKLREAKVLPKLKASSDFTESGHSALRAGPIQDSSIETIRTSKGKFSLGGSTSPFVQSITGEKPKPPDVLDNKKDKNKKKKKLYEPPGPKRPSSTFRRGGV